MNLKGSKTEACLKAAFAVEAQANRRYLYFANIADIKGAPETANLFRSLADGESGHALGHLEYLVNGGAGDPETGLPADAITDALESALACETREYSEMYPDMARTARAEGFDEIADWFEALIRAERSHANKIARALAAQRDKA
ncbi:MAG: rubrerythrin family protein [Marinobacter sp.]|uniref:rubrerythrin family protein n=1 Tax=Marinobacter sp. TaxID=50741 RepID=UPI00299E60FA|nr:rubrerythrin family protein [Marinobacter sp.]MDX1634468.1 rubrerythrin family protein [Marinobacter sp.]